MYKIPFDFNISALNGKEIVQIGFGSNSITLYFSDGFIQIYGNFSFKDVNHLQYYNEIYPIKNDLGLLQVLDKKIIDVSLNEERDILSLKFENNCILVLDSDELYESYIVNIDRREIII